MSKAHRIKKKKLEQEYENFESLINGINYLNELISQNNTFILKNIPDIGSENIKLNIKERQTP